MQRRTDAIQGFTLVEILIVVVILGILAAIVIPQFTDTVSNAASTTTYSELQKLRRHIGVYQARHSQQLPAVTAGNGTWGQLVGPEHFLAPPVNAWVGGVNSRMIVLGNGPDTGYQTAYGWIFDPATGDVWAGGFDINDHPFPR